MSDKPAYPAEDYRHTVYMGFTKREVREMTFVAALLGNPKCMDQGDMQMIADGRMGGKWIVDCARAMAKALEAGDE